MKYRIKYLPDTVTDREEIKTYLSQFYGSTVKKFIVSLRKKTSQLKSFPYSCPVYELDTDYRKLVVGDYLVLYMVNEDAKTVEIHRIFHESQNIKQLLDKSKKNFNCSACNDKRDK